MTELYLVIFMACGKPVFVVMQPVGKDMRVYSQESMGKERWPEFLKLVEESRNEPDVASLELPVENQVQGLTCVTKT